MNTEVWFEQSKIRFQFWVVHLFNIIQTLENYSNMYSRDSSRDRSKSRSSYYKDPSFRSSSTGSQFKASQGPMLFKGTPNSSVKKNVQPMMEEDEDGFVKPMSK